MGSEHQINELASQYVRVRRLVRARQNRRTYSDETAFPSDAVDLSRQQRGAVRGGDHQAHHGQGIGLQRMFEDAVAHVPQAAFEGAGIVSAGINKVATWRCTTASNSASLLA